MTLYDPLASLVVPIPPYRGRGAVLPQVRLTSTDGPPSGPSEDELLQAGSAVEGLDSAARAVEAAAEQPKPNPLENMALTLAVEQQQEAIKFEAGQAHTTVDAEPPLHDADAAAKQEAHVGITGVENAAVTDIAGVSEQLPQPVTETPAAEVEPVIPPAAPAEAPPVEAPPAAQEEEGVDEELQKHVKLVEEEPAHEPATEERLALVESAVARVMKAMDAEERAGGKPEDAPEAALLSELIQERKKLRKELGLRPIPEARSEAKPASELGAPVAGTITEKGPRLTVEQISDLKHLITSRMLGERRFENAGETDEARKARKDIEQYLQELRDGGYDPDTMEFNREIEAMVTDLMQRQNADEFNRPFRQEAPTAIVQEEPPKEAPQPGDLNRFGRFDIDQERLSEMSAEKIAAAQNLDELYAAIRAADGFIVNERGVRYPAADVIANIEEVRRTGPTSRGFATGALGIREKALALLRQENPNFGYGGTAAGIPEIMQGIGGALRAQVEGRVPPRPPRTPAEAVIRTAAGESGLETPSVEAAPAAAAQERQEPTPQQQIEELRRQVAELTRRLNAPPGPAGAEAAPTAAQELGAAATPPEGQEYGDRRGPEYGPEQPETSGAAEQAMEAIDGVAELGTDQELGFWERKGMQAESVLHDVAAWWSGAWAVRAKNSQKAREKKVRQLERAAQRSAKTFTGALLNPIKYGARINYHRWREGRVRAAWEKNNDKRMRYESKRNEVLSRVAEHMELPLRSYELKAEEYRKMIEGAEADLQRLNGVIGRIAIEVARLPDGEDKDELLRRHGEFMEQKRNVEEAKDMSYDEWQKMNAKAGRIQRINNQILKKANPGDRPQTGGVVREILSARASSPMPRPPATSPPGKLPPTRTP